MAKKYLHNETEIAWEGKRDDDRYLRLEVTPTGKRIEARTFNPPRLNRQNAADLRDWLTAWLERTAK